MVELLMLIVASAGGGGVVIIAFSKIFGDFWAKRILLKHENRLKEDFERFRNDLKLEQLKATWISKNKFELYGKIWRSLYKLDRDGDLLWDEPSPASLRRFIHQLHITKDIVGENEIYLKIDEKKSLTSVLEMLCKYSENKGKVVDLCDIHTVTDEVISEIKSSNAELRNDYKRFIEKISAHLSNQL